MAEDKSATDAAQEDQVNAVVEEGDESQWEDAAVARFEGFSIAIEIVEEFLDNGLIDSVVVPCN